MPMIAYKYRLYPTKKQIARLQWTLDRCRELYNAALQERRDAYRMAGKSITYHNQAAQLPDIKQIREEYQDIYSQVLQDVLRRIEKAFKRFFQRCQQGKNPGCPRFQGKGRYDSFTYPQSGFSLTHDNRVFLAKLGSIKVKLHRPLEGKVKTCTVKREGNQWYIVFVCEVEQKLLPPSEEAVGIDLGLLHFATLSTGETVENPRYLRHAEKKLKHMQQALSRKQRGSRWRRKAMQRVAKQHRTIRNQRRDYLHKASRKLVNEYGLIVMEDLQIANMSKRPEPKQDEAGAYLLNGAAAKAGLNKSIRDAGWGLFQQYCAYKAANAGRIVLLVDPRNTSQRCSQCGKLVKKDLSERWHSCGCGCSLDRDHNSAINILWLGRSHQGQP